MWIPRRGAQGIPRWEAWRSLRKTRQTAGSPSRAQADLQPAQMQWVISQMRGHTATLPASSRLGHATTT